jgi:hypothetical protein
MKLMYKETLEGMKGMARSTGWSTYTTGRVWKMAVWNWGRKNCRKAAKATFRAGHRRRGVVRASQMKRWGLMKER